MDDEEDVAAKVLRLLAVTAGIVQEEEKGEEEGSAGHEERPPPLPVPPRAPIRRLTSTRICNEAIFSRRFLFRLSRCLMYSTALNRIVLLELLMFFKVGIISVISLKPLRIVLRRFCSDAMWFARFSSSVRSSLVPDRLLLGLESRRRRCCCCSSSSAGDDGDAGRFRLLLLLLLPPPCGGNDDC